ncbi:MAG: hypothetical protein AAFQ94_31210 [Bacteroidota bacterium]
MIKLFALLLLTVISFGATAQKKLDLAEYDNARQTILLTGFNEAYPIKLFGNYRLRGSILTAGDILLTRFSPTGDNVVRNGYSATGFMAIDGVGIQSEIRYNSGRYTNKKGFSVRNILLNRPQQGFLQERNLGISFDDGLRLNVLTPFR